MLITRYNYMIYNVLDLIYLKVILELFILYQFHWLILSETVKLVLSKN